MTSKEICDTKLKAFSIGAMGKRVMSKKEQQSLRLKQDEEEVGKVYEEYVSAFNETPDSRTNKTWVKAGIYDAGSNKHDNSERGQLYRPHSKHFSSKVSSPTEREVPVSIRPNKLGTKKDKIKKKSNLEIFKEELKAIQEERQERHRVKGLLKNLSSSSSKRNQDTNEISSEPVIPTGITTPVVTTPSSSANILNVKDYAGSHDYGDPLTTNLYLGNINPVLSEHQLMEIFGKYGPLASVKIMWPRTDDEKTRGRHSGFVAFMARSDAERAYEQLLGKDIDGFEMKMGWGKTVPIPLHPVYTPPSLVKYSLPPSPSGLPFNCQPDKMDAERWNVGRNIPYPAPNDPDYPSFLRLLYRSTVKVVIPTDRTILCLINRMVEFVVREGPVFEAMIMNREVNNANFRFLFDNKLPEHIYYRWRLYSILQGDSKDSWSLKPFRMFYGGSLWKPPPINMYCAGMPEELVREQLGLEPCKPKKIEEGGEPEPERERKPLERSVEKISVSKNNRRGMSNSQRERFEEMIRNMTPDRNPVAEAMVWCIEHAEAGEEIVDCITESLSVADTPFAKKVARLYLISDILHNCSVKGVPNVSYYRQGLQAKLPRIFKDLNYYLCSIESRIKAEAFKQRILLCFRAWSDWALYPQEFLIQLQNTFLGLQNAPEEINNGGLLEKRRKDKNEDGVSSEEDSDDGIPLDGAALLKSALRDKRKRQPGMTSTDESDIDGAPLEEIKTSQVPYEATAPSLKTPGDAPASVARFAASKWETVDPEEVQAQAVTTSKWDFSSVPQQVGHDDDDTDVDDLDGVPVSDDHPDVYSSEQRRNKLREVEVQIMQFQDDLEAGRVAARPGWTISEQVEQFRKKLLSKTNAVSSNRDDIPSLSPSRYHHRRRSRKKERHRRHRHSSPDNELSFEEEDMSPRRFRKRRSRSISPPSYQD